MKQTKKITLSAMMTALGVSLMALGAVIDTIDLTVCALASLCVAFVYLEVGSPYTFFTWICTSVLAWIMFPHSMLWMEFFLLFGIYPILKGYIEHLPRALWLPVKIVTFTAMIWGLIGAVQWVFAMPFFLTDALWKKIALYALCNVAFVVYDVFLTMAVRVYLLRVRPGIGRWLK